MFKKVETEKEEKDFRFIWSEFIENEVKGEYWTEDKTERHILLEDEKPVGTVEFQKIEEPIVPNIIKLAELYKNNRYLEIATDDGNAYILGKLSVRNEKRGKGFFPKLIALIYQHSSQNNVKWYTGAINKPVYETLKRKGIPVEKIGSEFKYSKATLVPYIIDVEKTVKVLHETSWFLKFLHITREKINTN